MSKENHNTKRKIEVNQTEESVDAKKRKANDMKAEAKFKHSFKIKQLSISDKISGKLAVRILSWAFLFISFFWVHFTSIRR